MPTYGAVISCAAVAGVGAFVCVLILGAPREGAPKARGSGGGNTARVEQPPSDPDELEMWLANHPDSPRSWLVLGSLRHDQGRTEDARRAWLESRRLYEERVARENPRPGWWYGLACCRARLGDRQAALDALRQSAESGWGDPERARTDPDLESIRSDPRFEGIVTSMAERPRIFNAG